MSDQPALGLFVSLVGALALSFGLRRSLSRRVRLVLNSIGLGIGLVLLSDSLLNLTAIPGEWAGGGVVLLVLGGETLWALLKPAAPA